MKIIKVNPNNQIIDQFTVDTTLYTADSTLITADKSVENVENVNYLIISPSIYATNYDVVFFNELTKETNTYNNCSAKYEKRCIYILLPQMILNEGDRFDVIVKYEDKNVWIGSVLATDNDTQTYQLTNIINDKIKF